MRARRRPPTCGARLPRRRRWPTAPSRSPMCATGSATPRRPQRSQGRLCACSRPAASLSSLRTLTRTWCSRWLTSCERSAAASSPTTQPLRTSWCRRPRASARKRRRCRRCRHRASSTRRAPASPSPTRSTCRPPRRATTSRTATEPAPTRGRPARLGSGCLEISRRWPVTTCVRAARRTTSSCRSGRTMLGSCSGLSTRCARRAVSAASGLPSPTRATSRWRSATPPPTARQPSTSGRT
mmetsp:Transcript_48750/g.154470  ORF Transcript_48750/g.154470 Transcript_48750/m.154470 type:complete len:240 (+) Transcript_48750:68-787(+)